MPSHALAAVGTLALTAVHTKTTERHGGREGGGRGTRETNLDGRAWKAVDNGAVAEFALQQRFQKDFEDGRVACGGVRCVQAIRHGVAGDAA